MKKLLSLILIFVILLTLTLTMQAEEMHKEKAVTTVYQAGTYFADSDSITLAADYSNEIKQIADGMRNMETLIYIKNSKARASEYNEIIRQVINQHPEFFYVSPSYYYYFREQEKDPVVAAIEPIYTMNAEEAGRRLELMDKEVRHIIDTCISDSMSDYDKALEIHDYFCINYEYDTTSSKHSADYMLVEKTGVCEAYSLAYKYVLSKLGIDCDYASSDEMNHMWNMVESNNDWFHVDVTWDDPVPNVKGRAKHKYFMVDDETFEAEGHYGWSAGHKADTKTYADSPLREIDSAIYLRDGKYYHIDAQGNLCSSPNICSGNCKKVFENKSKYYIADKAGYYFTKMSYLVEEDNCFYFTEADGVYKFDYSHDAAKPVRIYSAKGNKYPVELIINNGRLSFKTATPYSDGSMSYGQPATYSVEHDGLFGDADNDGEVLMSDAVKLARLTVKGIVLTEKGEKLGDVDGDGEVTMADAVRTAKNTVGSEL